MSHITNIFVLEGGSATPMGAALPRPYPYHENYFKCKNERLIVCHEFPFFSKTVATDALYAESKRTVSQDDKIGMRKVWLAGHILL